jgi:hypothetical protein
VIDSDREMNYERIEGEMPERRDESTRTRNLRHIARDENKIFPDGG